jgi:protein-tyrosine phosphatase
LFRVSTHYVDIHAHLLPGVDDGPSELEESLAMARAAFGSGTATLATTPHLHPDFPAVRVEEIASRCQQLREDLDSAGIGLELIAGAEVSLTWALDASDEELLLASYGQRGTDLLIETPFTHVPALDRFLSPLVGKGYRITLAHPERNSACPRNAAPLKPLVEQGVLLQVNAGSLLGPGGGREVRRLSRQLVTDGLAHVIASDGHRASSWRPVTRLAEAIEVAAELVGRDRAMWMAEKAPAAILSGSELPPAPPIERPRPGWRLFRRR